MQIPGFEHSHALQSIHIRSVSTHALSYSSIPLPAIETIFSRRQIYAGGQTLEIPFPRANNRFIKVVQVENHISLRSTIQPKVVEVRLPIDNGRYSSAPTASQIMRHYRCSSPKECKW